MSFVGIAISLCGGLLVTPAILGSIGDREYGFFTLASSLIALIMLLDLGASDGSIRFLIAAKRGKVGHPQTWVLDQINHFYFLLAILVAVISVVLSFTYPYSLNGITADQYSRITVILSIAFAGLVVSISCNGYNSVLIAEQRFFFLKTLDLATQSLMIVLLLIAAFTNCGTIALITITSILAATPAVLKRAYAHRFLNYRRGRPAIDVGFIRSILFYSMPILVVSAGQVVYWKLDFLIIGWVLSPEAITMYAIGIIFNKHLLRFAKVFSGMATPELIRLLEEDCPPEEILDQYLKISRLQFMSVFYVLIGVLLFGRHFLTVWLGPEYLPAYYIFLTTIVAYSFEVVGNMRNTMLQVKRLYWIRAVIVAFAAILNIGLTIILMKYLGVIGAAAASAAGILVSLPLVLLVMYQKFDFPVLSFYGRLARGILPAGILATLSGLPVAYWNFPGWGGLFVKAGCFSVIYWALVWILGLSNAEKDRFRQICGSAMARVQLSTGVSN